jgi:Cu/Ag efflux protein CusF
MREQTEANTAPTQLNDVDKSMVAFNGICPTAQQGELDGIFWGAGVVTAIDPATGSLTLNHEEIKGLMPAMEMMYLVNPRSLSEVLRLGTR